MYFFPASRGSKKLDLVTWSGVGKLGKQLCLVVIYCNSRYFHTFADYNITRSQVWSKLFSYVQHQQIARIRSLYSSNEQFMHNFIVVFNAKLTNEVNCETWPRVYLMLSLKNHKMIIKLHYLLIWIDLTSVNAISEQSLLTKLLQSFLSRIVPWPDTRSVSTADRIVRFFIIAPQLFNTRSVSLCVTRKTHEH